MGAWWDEDKTLWLLTPEEFSALPDGIVLTDINGEKATKGTDGIDNDTRFGHLAYGLVSGQDGFPHRKEAIMACKPKPSKPRPGK